MASYRVIIEPVSPGTTVEDRGMKVGGNNYATIFPGTVEYIIQQKQSDGHTAEDVVQCIQGVISAYTPTVPGGITQILADLAVYAT